MLYFGLTIVSAMVFGGVILSINSFFKKPGKYFQNIGTAIKTVPLFFVILLFLVMIFANLDKINFSVPAGIGPTGKTNKTLLVFMTMPAILFSFDGFILAGALSPEAKTKKTFKIAFVASMIFIISVYIIFSVAIFGLSDPSKKDTYGTITNAIMAAMPQAGKVIAPIVVFIVFTSILTGVSGCSIASARMLSDLSAHNAVVDKKGKLITKNKAGISTYSGLSILLISFL